VVRGDQALLDQWFNEQIVPLYDQQKTLVLDSIRRKIGVLRESLRRALETRLRPFADLPSERLKELQASDQHLRAAAGRIANVEKDAIRASESIRDLAPVAITCAARRLVDAWHIRDKIPSREIVRDAIADVARNAAGEIVSAIDTLAGRLSTALAEAAKALEMSVPTLDEELRASLRDLPQIDLSQVSFDSAHPFLAHFGEWMATYSAERQLRTNIEDAASAAFTSYGRVIQTWITTALGQMRHKFDAHADGYRAQFARMLSPVRESADDRDGLESEIEWLQGE
jgi:hypothetical protein